MILDSDVLIDLLRNKPNALAWYANLPANPSLSAIAVMEVLFGARDLAELRRIKSFLHGLRVAWVEPADFLLAESYARLRLSNGIGILDAITAALAVRVNEPLVTFNVKHFIAVPNLTTIQPYNH